jgi:hypothetical protein
MTDQDEKKAELFYEDALKKLVESKIPFLLGGTYAFRAYTGIYRQTHDIDIFCKASDYPLILKLFDGFGFKHEITDARWLAKVFKNNYFMDVIFSTTQGVCPVNDTWFKRSHKMKLFNTSLQLMPVEELIWSKSYRQERDRYDGSDINHLILKKGDKLDWKHLLTVMEQHWEVLFAHIINFRFVYPADRDIVPKWVMKELINRVSHQLELSTPKDKVCRGKLLSAFQYNVDVNDWGYKDFNF